MKKDSSKRISKELRSIRCERFSTCLDESGITQKAIAEKLNVSPTAVGKWKTGKSSISDDIILGSPGLAEIFHVRPEYLLGIDNFKTEPVKRSAIKNAHSDIEKKCSQLRDFFGIRTEPLLNDIPCFFDDISEYMPDSIAISNENGTSMTTLSLDEFHDFWNDIQSFTECYLKRLSKLKRVKFDTCIALYSQWGMDDLIHGVDSPMKKLASAINRYSGFTLDDIPYKYFSDAPENPSEYLERMENIANAMMNTLPKK